MEFSDDIEACRDIKNKIDWQIVDGQTLHVDFLEEQALNNYEGMQSRCLLISDMPEDFLDVSKLREIYGCVTSPVYCQVRSLSYQCIIV